MDISRLLMKVVQWWGVMADSQPDNEQTHNTSLQNTSEHNLPDLISALPDSLLLHILSLLNMDQIMKTSLLSRRWRYLWKSIPCLCFEWLPDLPKVANFIDKCLFHHEGSKIQKLHINVYFEHEEDTITYAPLVDSWLHFAIKCKVEDIMLDCCYIRESFQYADQYDQLYRLPHSFYLCTTLTSLYLCGCNLNLPDSFQFGSLKKLSLVLVQLHSDSVEHFTSSCPLLEEIYLIDCNRDIYLMNIVITNEHVKRLVISDFGDYESETVKINAPTLLSLGIYDCNPGIRFQLEELGSLISADFIGDPLIFYSIENDDVHNAHCVQMLLYDFRHVKHLKLCALLIQVLSLMKLKSSKILPISATSLELNVRMEKWELPGTSYLLECCSNLQKLKIVNDNYRGGVQLSDKFIDEHDFKEEEYWKSFETADVEPSIVQNIKTIEIDLRGESRHEEFVRFLLKNAKVLERMVIDTPKKYANNFELLFKLRQRLNAFPRSSPNAKLFIS